MENASTALVQTLKDKLANTNVDKVISVNPKIGSCPSVYNDWGDSHRG
jgi:hypothetical protein